MNSETKTSELIIPAVVESKELKPHKNESQQLVHHIDERLKNKGLSYDDAIAHTLIDAILNAEAPDNRGELHTDYRTRLKAWEMLIKLKDKTFDKNDVHFNFFQAPDKLDY